MSVKCEVKFRWWTHEGSNEPSTLSYFIIFIIFIMYYCWNQEHTKQYNIQNIHITFEQKTTK